jgi:glycine cleavage system H protein
MSTQNPSHLKYTKEHEWTLIEGDIVTIGVTNFAQSALGDIVFVETPAIGTELTQGSTFGVVESIKSVSDLYAPVSGVVVEKNEDVEASPEKINESAFEAWLIKVKIKNSEELKTLLSAEDYEKFCQTEA